MSAREVVEKWIIAFNAADVAALENLYATNAVNHQLPNEAVIGRAAIGKMFREEFKAAPFMQCIPVQIIEQNDWAVLEWKDLKGFAGCGFFQIKNDLIEIQRGYWDKLSFKKLYGIEF